MKRYILNNNRGWRAAVTIDPQHPLAALVIRQMVDSSQNGAQRLTAHKGDYTEAFLQLLGETIQPLAERMDTKRVIDELLTMGGWAPLDGWAGITLEDVGHFTFPEVYFSEVAA